LRILLYLYFFPHFLLYSISIHSIYLFSYHPPIPFGIMDTQQEDAECVQAGDGRVTC
jgi:hypothetical protein